MLEVDARMCSLQSAWAKEQLCIYIQVSDHLLWNLSDLVSNQNDAKNETEIERKDTRVISRM